MQVEGNDVFGGTVNFAARVVGAIREAEIWLSERGHRRTEGQVQQWPETATAKQRMKGDGEWEALIRRLLFIRWTHFLF